MDRASAAKMVDSGSISCQVKPNQSCKRADLVQARTRPEPENISSKRPEL